MFDLLLRTKLFQPALRPSVIARPQLVERLNAALSPDRASFATRLTLISAPAGFGKTTLVSAWLAQLATTKRHFPGVQAAWLSLDSGDNDLVRFLAYVIAALRLVVPGAGSAAEPFLLSPQTPAPEMILTLLINDLSQNDQLMVLVLDDYDAISLPAIHQALAFLLDHLPPSLHVLITTRSDPPLPLSRLRARCQMIEIRAADLRFTPGEARLFLTQALGLPLADEDMAALETRAEGWIAGLQLVALSMQGHDSPPDFIRAFAGSHRYILDYLTEEVLERRPAGTKDFLLRTSILNRLCGPLCDAITGQAEGQVILERLEHANLFLTPLDEERHWYRYHQLFAEVLRRRLQQEQPGIVPHLHQQASAWLEQHGLLHEAVNHALAGNDYERAASLIERVHGAKWQSGEIRTLQDWLAALPEASWRAHPRLWLVQAWAAMTVGAFAEADEHLHGAEAALDRLDAPAARSLRPEVTAFRASYASLVQDPSAVPLAQQALQELPGDYWMRGMLVVFLGAAYYVMGDLDSALAVLAQAPGAGPPAVDAPLQPHQIHLLAFGGMVHHARGQLRMAWSRIQQALALAEPGGKPIPFVGTLLAYMAASLVLYEQGELALVETYLSRCLQQAVSFGSAEVQVFALSGLARLHLALGDPQAAAETYQQIDVLLQQHTFNLSISAYVDYHRFLLLLKQEDVAGAAGWIAAHAGQPGPLNAYALHRLARPQFLLAQGDFAGAQEDLAALVTEAEASGHGAFLLKALVLQALALHLDGRSDQAHETLERALALAEPEGFVRAFVDEGEVLRELLAGYRAAHAARSGPALAEGPRRLPAYAGRLLAAFPPADARSTLASEPHLDPLSEREMEVLLLVATGASNRDIAGELFLAVPTVKKHVSNILSKLNASSRTQAVAEARALGLL